MAVQESPTSIRVSWIPPSSLGDNTVTGYRIYYSSTSASSESVTVHSYVMDYLLKGLQNGDNYTIKLVATSQHFPSTTIVINVTLSEFVMYIHLLHNYFMSVYNNIIYVTAPGPPNVTVDSLTASSISLSWSVPSGSVVISFEVSWRAVNSDGGTTEADGDERGRTSGSITDTSYTIGELESGTLYSITVKATNGAGSTVSQPIIVEIIISKENALHYYKNCCE